MINTIKDLFLKKFKKAKKDYSSKIEISIPEEYLVEYATIREVLIAIGKTEKEINELIFTSGIKSYITGAVAALTFDQMLANASDKLKKNTNDLN